ncbi:MAG TPA: uroporphyrinogen-III synthase [Acidimicrobiales bacterium]|nr:uroporphyrinogen-III synthase [Acidimicrobiales bacterium]
MAELNPRVAVVRVAVTRAAAQADELGRLLRGAGFEPVTVPVIDIVDPADGGVALRAAATRLAQPGRYDWVVLTSVNGAERLIAAAPPPWGVDVAAIGPATAERLGDHGVTVALVPPRFVAESLVDVFPRGPGKVLLTRAAVARDVLPDGLRAKGWTVDVVDAYRTIAPEIDERQRDEIASCAIVTFTSPSTVNNFVELLGVDALPSTVACIGPITAAACGEHGIVVHVEAEVHTMAGLVDALTSRQNALPGAAASTTIDP